MNSVNITGRIGKEPEVKVLQSGSKVCNLSLAVDRRGKDNNKETDWFDLQAWGKTADFAANYVKKGGLVGITGMLQTRSWEAQDGSKRFATYIVVEKIDLLSRTEQTAPTEQPTQNAPVEPDGQLPFEI